LTRESSSTEVCVRNRDQLSNVANHRNTGKAVEQHALRCRLDVAHENGAMSRLVQANFDAADTRKEAYNRQ
jgi:hypothetical protein